MFDRVCPCLVGTAPFVTFNHYPVQGRQWESYLDWFRNTPKRPSGRRSSTFQQAFWHLWDDSHPFAFPSAFIAHFAIKSLADFQRRVDRGMGGEFRTQ